MMSLMGLCVMVLGVLGMIWGGGAGPVQKERGPQCFIFVSPKLDKVFEVADWRWNFLCGIDDHGAGAARLGSVVYGHYLSVWPWV